MVHLQKKPIESYRHGYDYAKFISAKDVYVLLSFKSDPESSNNWARFFNLAFVHAIVVPEVDMLEKLDKICVVARGDGVVDVINIESEFTAAKSKARKTGQTKSNGKSSSQNPEKQDQNQRTRLRLDYSCGGHTAAVSCV